MTDQQQYPSGEQYPWGQQPHRGQPVQYQPPPRKPIHRRAWFWILIVGLLFFGGCTAAVIGAAGTALNEPTDVTNADGISRGAGSKDATGDVRIVSVIAGEEGVLEITNHSGKRSDYYVELRELDSKGTNIGMSNATVDALDPGQKAKATFYVSDGVAKVEVTEVQRTATV